MTVTPRSIAAFVSPAWGDQSALRLWTKLLVDVDLVLLTDDASDGNAVIARQLRCSKIVCAIARLPTVLRSQAEIDQARRQRDTTMAAVADLVVDFGGVFAGVSHKPVTVVPMDPL